MSSLQEIVAQVTGATLGLLERVRKPTYRGRLELQGLTQSVEIIRDSWGVPHIYAGSVKDMLFAQGFVHAQDRLWQMEYQRRVVAGRLAEVLGSVVAEADRNLRILGMRRVAEIELGLINDDALCGELEAYAAGVNAYIEREPLPVEFTLLRYRPEPWTPVDSLSWAKMISWGLSINWETELLRAALIKRLGPDEATQFEPPPPIQWPVVTPSNGRHAPSTGEDTPPPTRAARMPKWQGEADMEDIGPDFPPIGAAQGSNNWIVGGARTESGRPLLANDMHLPLTAPAIWYENHIVSAEDGLSVTGVSFPGVPYVIAGHNGHVAWGFTNGYPDVQDLFIERLRRGGENGVEYEFRGEWLPAEVRHEIIRVKGRAPLLQEVVVTHHGPVINELASGLASPLGEDGLPTEPLALRWTSLDPDTMVDAVRGINRSRSCIELREALRGWAAPIQNVVYADTDGNIAYSYPGCVPVRANGDGRVPAPGWTGDHEWIGYVPFEELPHQLNPQVGYVVSANNRPVDDGFAHFIGSEFAMGDRAQRIVNLIESYERLDAASLRQMHFDQYASSMHAVARHLGSLSTTDAKAASLSGLLKAWDGHLTAESAAGAICETFLRLLGWVLLEDRLGTDGAEKESRPSLAERLMGTGPTPLIQQSTFFSARTFEWLLNLLGQTESPWFRLGGVEGRDNVLALVLSSVYDYLEKRLGRAEPPAFAGWEWGRLHTVTFGHVVGSVPALAAHFNRGPFPLGGDFNTIWATGSGIMPADSTKVIGPPFRFIADLGDLSKSLGLLAPGNSGRPDSPHYDDQITAWFEGNYHPMLYRREDVEREAEATLSMAPPQASGMPAAHL